MLATTLTQNPAYILGHSTQELQRLIEQAAFFGDLTAQVLESAGLRPGMRVLDVGCGAGDVSFLAAGLVGPEGMVIGVDKSAEAVALASQRAAAAGVTNVRFETHDLSELVLDDHVDALIGRLVLMYFTDPAVLLRRLSGLLNPGAIVAFHEIDLEGAKSEPRCQLFETTVQRIKQTFTRVGVDIQTGLKLGTIFEEAGLPSPQMILGARVERGSESLIYDQIAQVARTLLPAMQRTGIATAEEMAIDTLARRIRQEVTALNATLVSPLFIGAWSRKVG